MRIVDADWLEKNLSNDLPYKGSVKRVLIQAPIVETATYGLLYDWYISSVDDTQKPKWTPEHIEELLNDFYVIPKQE